MRLSVISSKTAWKNKKCIFCWLLSLCWTVSQPYKLSHTNFLHINQLTQKPIHAIFMKKYWELKELENEFFFWVGHFNFAFDFTLSQWKQAARSYEVSFFSALWMVTYFSKKLRDTDLVHFFEDRTKFKIHTF